MAKTKDGREVLVAYTGNVFKVYVQEYAGSLYSKDVFTMSSGTSREYLDKVENEIAENDGVVPHHLFGVQK
jgi:hypothetical protein